MLEHIDVKLLDELDEAASSKILAKFADVVPEIVNELDGADSFQRKIEKVLQRVPEGPSRFKLLQLYQRGLGRHRAELDRAIVSGQREIERLHAGGEVLEKLRKWASGDLILQKPIGTMIQAFQEALTEDRVFDVPSKRITVPRAEVTAWKELAAGSAVFMVQHNWGDAFRNAKDYLGGDVRLPDETCAFEFRINDRHVIAFATDADGALYLQHAVQVKKGFVILPMETDADFSPLSKATNEQIKAISVALDAEIATTEVIRAPHRSNCNRGRAELPAFSYHVVNLARRTRAAPLAGADREPTYHVRLHFRRGHWRHFENHKTWIKWMLVGDPELGFVDKEYRL